MTADPTTDLEVYRASLDRLMRQAPVAPGEQRAALRAGRDDRLEFTRHRTDQMPWTVADDDTVRSIVEDHLFNPDPDVWNALTADPHIAGATHRSIVGLKLELQRQSTARRAAAETKRQQCLAQGGAGRKPWLTYKRDWEDWRRRAQYVEQRVTVLLRYIKDRRKQVNRAETEGEDRRAWEALTKAVAAHRDSSAPDRDQVLYRALDRIEVRGESLDTHRSHWTW